MVATTHSIPELDRQGLRDFGLTTGAIIAGLFGLLLPWIFGFSWPKWPWILFAVLGTLALTVPVALRPIYQGWMRFGLLMSRITTPLILGIVFFGLLLPMALIMKLMKRDPMARDLDAGKSSYRVESKKAQRQNLERPF